MKALRLVLGALICATLLGCSVPPAEANAKQKESIPQTPITPSITPASIPDVVSPKQSPIVAIPKQEKVLDAPPITSVAIEPIVRSAEIVSPIVVASAREPKTQPTDNAVSVVTPANAKPATAATTKLPKIPDRAVPLIPVLRKMTDLLWPDIPFRSFMASKIEQESCISLTHKKCWSPYAELKTSREYGFGFGQTTIAYNKDGSERFNVWKELRVLDPELKRSWTWENRFDAELQIRALLVKSKISHNSVRFAVANEYEHMAFGAVTYNSGSVLIDRKLCINTKGCDPSRWFGNVEKYSSKSRIAQKGYGKSFYEISREYPRNVLIVRRPKYIPYLDN